MIFPYRVSFFFSFAILFFSLPVQNQTVTDILQPGMALAVDEKYDKAQILFTDFIENNPADPRGHLLLASVQQSKMMDFETQLWRNSFMKEIDRTIHLSDSLLKADPNNIAMQFYHASALGYKSFQISREGSYIKGLRLALKAVHGFNAVIERDSLFYDAYLGLGSYLYWRSYLTRNFTWLPFFKDQREQGIAFIQKSFEKGVFSRWAAFFIRSAWDYSPAWAARWANFQDIWQDLAVKPW